MTGKYWKLNYIKLSVIPLTKLYQTDKNAVLPVTITIIVFIHKSDVISEIIISLFVVVWSKSSAIFGYLQKSSKIYRNHTPTTQQCWWEFDSLWQLSFED